MPGTPGSTATGTEVQVKHTAWYTNVQVKQSKVYHHNNHYRKQITNLTYYCNGIDDSMYPKCKGLRGGVSDSPNACEMYPKCKGVQGGGSDSLEGRSLGMAGGRKEALINWSSFSKTTDDSCDNYRPDSTSLLPGAVVFHSWRCSADETCLPWTQTETQSPTFKSKFTVILLIKTLGRQSIHQHWLVQHAEPAGPPRGSVLLQIWLYETVSDHTQLSNTIYF